MDTEEFLIKAEEIAKEHPEDEMAVQFLAMCDTAIINERECLTAASKIILKHAV